MLSPHQSTRQSANNSLKVSTSVIKVSVSPHPSPRQGNGSYGHGSKKPTAAAIDPLTPVDNVGEQEDRPTDRASELREPFVFVKWITNHPRLSFGLGLGLHVLFLVASGILVASGYDLFPANFDSLPMELLDEPWLKRDYAWQDRDEFPNSVDRRLPPTKFPNFDRAFVRYGLVLFYDAGDGNIFTKTNLQLMQTIENRLVNVTQFSSFCQITASGTCVPPLSVLRFFDGTYVSVDPVFHDPDFDNIDAVLYAAYTRNETKSAFAYALGKKNTITKTSVSSTLTRTSIPFGWPLPGYSDEKAMLEALTDFMVEYMKPVLDSYLEVSEFEFVFFNQELMLREVFTQALYDMTLAVGSLVFIFFFIYFHTRSLWVTCMAVLSIVSSFIETNIVYRTVIGFKYFGFFHILAMFIILGIGADDLFVFWDAWKATGLIKFPSLAHRLNEAYRKSVISMLVTSVTTMTAFLANALSPLLATQSFGTFAAVLVVINYLSVVTFFPSIVIFYHLYFEDKPHPCCCCWHKPGEDTDIKKDPPSKLPATIAKQVAKGHVRLVSVIPNNTNSVTNIHQVPKQASPAGQSKNKPGDNLGGRTFKVNPNSEHKADENRKEGELSEKPSKLVIFFRDYYFAFVTHKIARWFILLFLVACLVALSISAARLQPDNEQVQLYTDSHHYTKAIKHNNGFVPNDQERTITVYLVWGLQENDLSGCHFSSHECRGVQSFDSSFDASTVAAQQAFVTICDTLFNFTDAEVSEYAIKRDLVTQQLEIACFPRHMEAFLKNDPVSASVDVSMPWNRTKTSDFMTSLSTHYNTSAFDSGFTNFLDIPLTYWIWDGFRQNNTEDYQIFNTLFGEETDTYTSNVLSAPNVTTGNKIKYMSIAINTTLDQRFLGYTEGIPIVERWEQFMKQQLSQMPAEMQDGFQTTIFAWHWLYVQRALAENAILGIQVGLALAFPVLVVATGNVFNGLLATLSIGCVTVCVIGVIPLGGWKLGVLVSLNMCLVVGLAVDFVVHLAEGYHMAHGRDRRTRLRTALERMGVSVFSGACTTLGASSFMLFAKLQFFFQFGIFMFSTIGFSLLFAMGFYVTLMGIVGPEGDVGDIRALFKKCCACCRPWKPGSRVDLVSEDTCSTVTCKSTSVPAKQNRAPHRIKVRAVNPTVI